MKLHEILHVFKAPYCTNVMQYEFISRELTNHVWITFRTRTWFHFMRLRYGLRPTLLVFGWDIVVNPVRCTHSAVDNKIAQM